MSLFKMSGDWNRTTYIWKFQMTYINQGVYKSNELSFGKMKSYLECHPNGKYQDSKGFMSLYLYKTGQRDKKFNSNFDCRCSVIQKSGNS